MLKKPSKKRPVLKRLKETYGYLRTSYGVQTREFFENSTLHGVKYIAETDRPFIERFMWFTCVTMGTVATGVVILSLWDKFQTNPTITGLDTDFHNWLVPFPAITLCPDKPASVQSITTYLRISDNQTDQEDNELIQFYQDLSQLSLNNIPKFVDKYHDGVPKQILPRDLRQLMLNITDQCEDIFQGCKFKDDPIRCCNAGSASFYPVLTESGFCFSFNSRHFGIDNTADNFNMQYIKETDIKWSLDFALISRKVLTPLYIINSDDMINIDLQPQLIWDSKVDKIMFSFKQTYTTEDTRQLSVNQRRCIFEDEVPLVVDKIYTYTACTIQCRMENIRSHCDCVPFFYPDLSGFQYCNLSRLQCVAKHLQEIKDVSRCGCQLGCQNTVYEVETQKVKPDTATTNKIQMGFVSWPMVRYKREVLFGWVDLLVSFGGIAGLFLGFSLLSAVEIIYYFTLRAFIAAFRERKYLNKVRKENSNKPQPAHDLSMTPYFIAPPLPGRGIDIVVRKFEKMDFQYGGNFKKNNKIFVVEMIPPFGIEFVN